jgi:hypothetical protein
LRRGLELGGWWPYFLALTDAILAVVVIAALAVTILAAVQTFDYLAVRGGGRPTLPLDSLLKQIAANPTAAEYWWVYSILLSSLIPCFLNLVIGGASLVRGIPGIPSLLLRYMPIRKAVPQFNRAWIAIVLTLQIALGVILGIAAQVFFIVIILGFVMPWLGIGLFEMAGEIVTLNLPARVGKFF